MMKSLLFVIPILICSIAFAQSDEEFVKQVVTSAYIEGIQNRGNVDDIRKGFHPSFNMLRFSNNEVKPFPIEEWITNIEKAKGEGKPTPRTEGKFISVDITGTAAVVKLELYNVENKKTFTDYLVLYKFNEGWRIVTKAFYRHP